MKIEEAIKWCESRYQGALTPGATKAYKMCLAALRAQQEAEKNEPLTLEELYRMDGQPIWWVDCKVKSAQEWCILRVVNGKFLAQSGGSNKCYVDESTYLEKWIAYRHPPKEAKNV